MPTSRAKPTKAKSITGLLSPALEMGLLGYLKCAVARERAQEKMMESGMDAVLGYLKKSEERTAKYEERTAKFEAPVANDFAERLAFFHGVAAPTMPPLSPFTDDRGSITNVAENSVGGVQVIVSKAGAVRAKHTHKTDTHVCYVVSGQVDYVECGADNLGMPLTETVSPRSRKSFIAGERFVTGPGIAHQMTFPVDTVMVVMSEHPRDPAGYDADIVKFTETL